MYSCNILPRVHIILFRLFLPFSALLFFSIKQQVYYIPVISAIKRENNIFSLRQKLVYSVQEKLVIPSLLVNLNETDIFVFELKVLTIIDKNVKRLS